MQFIQGLLVYILQAKKLQTLNMIVNYNNIIQKQYIS